MRAWWIIFLIALTLSGCGAEEHSEDSVGHSDVIMQPIADRIARGEGGNLHCFMVWQRGVTRLEVYGDAPGMAGMLKTDQLSGSPERRFNMHAISRSVIAMLVFIAIDEGEFKSLDSPLHQYLSTTPSKPRDWRKITLRHALDMRTGLPLDESATTKVRFDHAWNQLNRAESTLEFIFSQTFVDKPGETLRVSGTSTVLLAKALESVYGKPVEKLAEEKLFTPLGITSAQWLRYQGSREIGVDFGLQLISADMVKLGQLVLQRGEWEGKPIFAEAWGDALLKIGTGNEQFGLQFWRLSAFSQAIVAKGEGEQYIVISPQKEAVIVSTAGNYLQEGEPILGLLNDVLPMLP
ncbi:serine hydrolase domain-containing protein [Thaumasiovibrio subtropicus]|uniref:serine hydrolase domain-containing protein n=1 Tax=Thaumasiovibrio subtropicus TaxID=1891207 RepID=UPI00131E1E71|nr:serine hydrolase [Thaumasiovibrio subtropicus]